MEIYFLNSGIRFIYALVELDGQKRLEELGVSKQLYYNAKKAEAWRNSIFNKIEENSNHPKAKAAITQLNKLYSSMTA